MSTGSPEHELAPVVVVGAGPAGMAAAVALAEHGCPVTVLDTYPVPGGQYHRTPAPGLEGPRGDARGGTEPGDPTVTAFRRHLDAGGIRLWSSTSVWMATPASATPETAAPDGTAAVLQLTGVAGNEPPARTLHARAVVLATGATDRVLPFPGSDLPGVFTVGGAQALLKGQGVRVGTRVVVAGSGPFLLPVAAALASAGSTVVAVAEAAPVSTLARHAPGPWRHRATLAEGAGYAATLLRHGVGVHTSTAVTAARGDGRVEEVTLSRLGPDWTPRPGGERNLAVDAACVSFGFVPQVGLAALLGCELTADPVWGDMVVAVDGHQRSSVPGVFAAGEATGVTGAAGAAAEGALAGLAVAHALGLIDVPVLKEAGRPWRRQRAHTRDLAAALGRMYPRGSGWTAWLTDDTVVCRCEEVDHATVRHAIEVLGAADLRSVKLTTRCGMGVCQGRMCGDAVADLVAGATDAPPTDRGALSTPTVLTPVPLRELAALADPV